MGKATTWRDVTKIIRLCPRISAAIVILGKETGVQTMDHLYNDGVTEFSHFPWRGSLTDDDEGLEPTIVRSMD